MEFSVENMTNSSPTLTPIDSNSDPAKGVYHQFLNFYISISFKTNSLSIYSLEFLQKVIDFELKNFSHRFGTIKSFGEVILGLIQRIPKSNKQQMSSLLKIFMRYLMISLQVQMGKYFVV
jgi:hypothetical protein